MDNHSFTQEEENFLRALNHDQQRIPMYLRRYALENDRGKVLLTVTGELGGGQRLEVMRKKIASLFCVACDCLTVDPGLCPRCKERCSKDLFRLWKKTRR
jgi:hypothetical protein